MICFSDSTEHGPAITINSPPPISRPFTRICVRPARNSLLTNLYGAEMRTTFSTCGMASTDSKHAVTSPTPTTPITTRSSPSMECTLYPKYSTCFRTSSISCRVACSFIEMIMAVLAKNVSSFRRSLLARLFYAAKKFGEKTRSLFCGKQKTHSVASGSEFFLYRCDYKFAPRLLFRWHPKSKPIRVGVANHGGNSLDRGGGGKQARKR